MGRSLANIMKNGQAIKSKFHKAQGIIQKLGPSMVEIRWFIDSDGSRMTADSENPISTFKREQIQNSIDKGSLTLCDPIDPNVLFLMRKHNVRS